MCCPVLEFNVGTMTFESVFHLFHLWKCSFALPFSSDMLQNIDRVNCKVYKASKVVRIDLSIVCSKSYAVCLVMWFSLKYMPP